MVGLDARARNRETVVRWHGEGFHRFWTWRWRARGLGERPSVSREIQALVCHMASANPLWGAPRIDGELTKLGIEISPRTVGRLLPRRGRPRSQSWGAFLENHVLGVDGFLRRTDRDVPRALRSAPSGSRAPSHRPFRRHRGQRSKLPRHSHGKTPRAISAEIATRPTAWSSASGSNEWASPR